LNSRSNPASRLAAKMAMLDPTNLESMQSNWAFEHHDYDSGRILSQYVTRSIKIGKKAMHFGLSVGFYAEGTEEDFQATLTLFGREDDAEFTVLTSHRGAQMSYERGLIRASQMADSIEMGMLTAEPRLLQRAKSLLDTYHGNDPMTIKNLQQQIVYATLPPAQQFRAELGMALPEYPDID
jgi:hypothetical protein